VPPYESSNYDAIFFAGKGRKRSSVDVVIYGPDLTSEKLVGVAL